MERWIVLKLIASQELLHWLCLQINTRSIPSRFQSVTLCLCVCKYEWNFLLACSAISRSRFVIFLTLTSPEKLTKNKVSFWSRSFSGHKHQQSISGNLLLVLGWLLCMSVKKHLHVTESPTTYLFIFLSGAGGCGGALSRVFQTSLSPDLSFRSSSGEPEAFPHQIRLCNPSSELWVYPGVPSQ